MTRSELTKRLARANPSLAHGDLERLVAVLFDAIGDQLVAGGRVGIRGFGSFWLKTRDARTGRNPRTGEEVAIAAKRVLAFRPSSGLTARLNRKA
jgi:integration host factor subunit beta